MGRNGFIFQGVVGTIAIGFLGLAARAQSGRVEYRVDLRDAAQQVIHVSMRLEGVKSESVDVRMPVWRPGLYQVLDQAGGIRSVSADHPIEKIDKSTWRVTTDGASSMTVSYDLWAASLENRTRHADDTHAFLSGESVFMYADDWRALPAEVLISPPEHSGGEWSLACGLPYGARDGFQIGAQSYDALVDAPIEVGRLSWLDFQAGGIDHDIAIWNAGEMPGADPRLAASPIYRQTPEEFAKIVSTTRAIFGKLPYDRYVFIIHCYPGAGGGTEHWNSCVMQTPPESFLDADRHKGFLSLAAHEFFHTWNVKRFRPAGLAPYDYRHENYTDLLWLAEGTTTYYSGVILCRAGLRSPEEYLKGLAASIESLRQKPGNNVQSVADASFDAWIKYNRKSPDAGNSTVSIYEKGSLVSFLLDMEIRKRTRNEKSLDTVIRTLFERFPMPEKGYTTDDLKGILAEIAGNFDEFFAKAVNGTGDLDFESALGVAGLAIAPEGGPGATEASAGLTLADQNGLAGVSTVATDGPACAAGLNPGDVIVALDGRRMTAALWDAAIKRRTPGDHVKVSYFRRDVLREVEFVLGSRPKGKLVISVAPGMSNEARAVYTSWLGHEPNDGAKPVDNAGPPAPDDPDGAR